MRIPFSEVVKGAMVGQFRLTRSPGGSGFPRLGIGGTARLVGRIWGGNQDQRSVIRFLPYHLRIHPPLNHHGGSMAKGDQHTEKMKKKPKKDTSAPKPPSTSDRPTPPVTTVVPVRGKLKNK